MSKIVNGSIVRSKGWRVLGVHLIVKRSNSKKFIGARIGVREFKGEMSKIVHG